MKLNRSHVESGTDALRAVVISSGAVETPGRELFSHDRNETPGPKSGRVLTRSDAAFVKRINRASNTSATLTTNIGLIAFNGIRATSNLTTRGHAGNGRRSEQNQSVGHDRYPGTAS